jgi:DNA (cytosine-5)-methyltransferase 1
MMSNRESYRILDLCCGGGGAAMGYWIATDGDCEIVGIDNQPQPKYPFKFFQHDALDYAESQIHKFDFVHVSPPCQRYSTITPNPSIHPDLISAFREILQASGKPYVIENVPGSPLINPVLLCGTMFGLNIIRHRLFETFPMILFAPTYCRHEKPVVKHGRRPDREKHYAAATGHFSDVEFVQQSMGIDWLGQKGLAQAIPPAFTKWVFEQIAHPTPGGGDGDE